MVTLQMADPMTAETRDSGSVRTGVYGWGYQGKSISDLIEDCELFGIGTVIDVRLTPWSHKQDFTKKNLEASLASAGVEYLHLKSLGNPKDNREGFVSGDFALEEEAKERFARAMDNPGSMSDLSFVKRLSEKQAVFLLCFEEKESQCHRGVLRSMLRGEFRTESTPLL